MDKIGKYKFIAEPFHCEFSGHLCLGHLGNHLLNAADFHATGRGFGMKHLLGIQRAWVLSRLAIEMEEIPQQLEHFNVETWIEGAMRYFTQRNFAITSDEGKVYGYGRSVWAMIDTETRQMTDIFSIEHGAIDQSALIVHLHLVGALWNSTFALLQDLVLQSRGCSDDAFL